MIDSPDTQAPSLVHGRHFNFPKLQAVLCMAASAAVSLGLLTWAVMAWLD